VTRWRLFNLTDLSRTSQKVSLAHTLKLPNHVDQRITATGILTKREMRPKANCAASRIIRGSTCSSVSRRRSDPLTGTGRRSCWLPKPSRDHFASRLLNERIGLRGRPRSGRCSLERSGCYG